MLDWKKWKNSELNLLEFILLSLIYQGSISSLPFNPKDEIDEITFESLIRKEYLREGLKQYYLTAKGAKVFNSDKTLFETFFETFPQKVPNNQGGQRMLRAVDLKGKNGSEAYRKWRMVTGGNEEKEKHILNCLEAEISLRKKQGELAFMNNIITWLNQRKWEFYEHLVEKENIIEQNKEKSI